MIGDNLQTDIKGANLMNQDSIFITDGIHLKEIKESKNIESIFKNMMFVRNLFKTNYSGEMKIFNNFTLPNNYKHCALAIGNFDGTQRP